ncbi:MAG: hypothetical protein GY694_19180 [Gammaproteobacteria bacterium]|nr:hypothetical protein [Gammaproteobacteria bacterium]
MSRALTNVSVMSQTMSDTSKNTFNSGNEFKIMAEQLKDVVEQFLHDSEAAEIMPKSPGQQVSANSSTNSSASGTQTTEIQDDIELF